MKAEILKNMNNVVDQINYIIRQMQAMEKEKTRLFNQLTEHRTELSKTHDINTFMNIINGQVVMEIKSK